MQDMGKVLVIGGLFLVIAGLLIIYGNKIGLGLLPGDMSFKKGNFTFYFPLASSIILSIILTIIFNLLFKK
jgi:hypothetical protein